MICDHKENTTDWKVLAIDVKDPIASQVTSMFC